MGEIYQISGMSENKVSLMLSRKIHGENQWLIETGLRHCRSPRQQKGCRKAIAKRTWNVAGECRQLL